MMLRQEARQPGPELPAPTKVPENAEREDCSAFSLSSLLATLPQEQELSPHTRAKGDTRDYSLYVSDDVLVLIFSYLSRQTLVKAMRACRRWSRVGYDKQLWGRVEMSKREVDLHSVLQLCSRGTMYLRMADTVLQDDDDDEQVDQLTEHQSLRAAPLSRATCLQYLDLSRAVIEENSLCKILFHCSHLKKLSLENGRIDNIVLILLVRAKDSLETLNLAMCDCRDVTTIGLEHLLKSCKSLTHLNLAWCGLDERSISLVCSEVPSSIKHLNISGTGDALQDHHVERLCRRCTTSLTELDLSDSYQLTVKSIEAIVQNLRNLTSLSISRSDNILYLSEPELGSLLNLRVLNVFEMVDDIWLIYLREALPHVQINEATGVLSDIARPTVGERQTSIWGERVRHYP